MFLPRFPTYQQHFICMRQNMFKGRKKTKSAPRPIQLRCIQRHSLFLFLRIRSNACALRAMLLRLLYMMHRTPHNILYQYFSRLVSRATILDRWRHRFRHNQLKSTKIPKPLIIPHGARCLLYAIAFPSCSNLDRAHVDDRPAKAFGRSRRSSVASSVT